MDILDDSKKAQMVLYMEKIASDLGIGFAIGSIDADKAAEMIQNLIGFAKALGQKSFIDACFYDGMFSVHNSKKAEYRSAYSKRMLEKTAEMNGE